MFSDYIVYVDESGDHGLTSIDAAYPVFVLSFCIFRKEQYREHVVPEFLKLKFQFFGHDMVVLHAHEIRKAYGSFRILVDPAIRQQFLTALTNTLQRAEFTLISSVIDKAALRQRYAQPENPYEIALKFCLERTYAFLKDCGQEKRQTHIVVECRGQSEDNALELAFRRIVQGDNRWGVMPFELIFADKKMNSTGLQVADLVSQPIGRQYLSPTQPNRSYDVVANKFRAGPNGTVEGYGKKIFP
jgi:hypothetical protein